MNLVQQLRSRMVDNRKHIVVVGDAMTDVYVHGHVTTCQDGCPKFVEESRIAVPGGAANAERSLGNWITPHCLSTSDGPLHSQLRVSLYGLGEKSRVAKVRFVDASGRIVFRHDDDIESNYIFRDNNHQQCYKWEMFRVLKDIEHAGAVLLSDYDKGFLTPEFIQQVVAQCKKFNIPCVADCKREPEVYAGCVLKGNQDYWSRYCVPIGADIIMTRGGGLPYSTRTMSTAHLPEVRLVNHVGAGDCFVAHLALTLAYGFSLREAAILAHSAGRVYVQSPHNRPPYPHEIKADLATSQ